MGAKRRLNGTSKVNTQTDTQTHRRTNQLIESIGPEGQCFENFEQKITHVFLRVFVTKCTYRIWVFLAFKPRRHSSTISAKIRKSLLSPCYLFLEKNISLHS